jgi:hypothetical protein
MRRLLPPLASIACLLALVCWSYGAVLVRHRQFGFRDAVQYYYPLHERVQKEWEAGRWPLWEPEESGGMPLLGNPTAAVFYPGKLLFAVLPYSWAARLYVIAHTAIAYAAMLRLLRSWSIRWSGATIGALGYAFGAPILFLYSNVVFLVGAAWAPLGFRGADQWLRLGWPRGLLELAVVLALQSLGGDPESAYLTGVCAGGYAVGLGGKQALLGERRPGSRFVAMLAGLAAAAVLALGLAAVQVIPALEFIGQSDRATGSRFHDIYAFSLEPVRALELIYPNVFGTLFAGNRFWLPLATPLPFVGKMWVPSLYLGGLTLVLALAAVGFSGGPSWRGWLSAVAVVSLAGSMGEFTGPVGWARSVPGLEARLGPHDGDSEDAARPDDGRLRDGDGGVYWVLASTLPGFRQFRYPSKLLSFTALALCALAGAGWDRLRSGHNRRPAVLAGCFLAVSVLGLMATTAAQPAIVAAWRASPEARAVSVHGPFDPQGAVAELQRALAQGTIVYSGVLLLVVWGRRRHALAAGAALVLLAVDLGLANTRYVFTVDQQLLDQRPRVVDLIERDQRAAALSPARPFRVHRLPLWQPLAWYRRGDGNRVAEVVAWERDTIQPAYGVRWGVQYTYTLGVTGLDDYLRFFETRSRPLSAAEARRLHARPGQEVVVYPRWALDLWNTRYFVLTAYPERWSAANPGIAALLDDTELVDPVVNASSEPAGRPRDWTAGVDFQLRRNLNACPRAWVVHAPTLGAEPSRRRRATDPLPPVANPLRFVELQRSQLSTLAAYLPGSVPTAAESVTIASYDPQRVELDVQLERPGIVVLADVHYPGWRLTIDGAEAPIERVNRMMRGAAVKDGVHRLVYTYDPRCFRIGAGISLAACAAAGVLVLLLRRWPRSG